MPAARPTPPNTRPTAAPWRRCTRPPRRMSTRRCRRAERARQQPAWAGLKRHERAGILYRIASGIRERGEELAQLQRLDNGKPINETPRPGGQCRRHLPVLRLRLRDLGRHDHAGARRLRHDERARAAGCGRRDHAVELADCQRGAEARAGAGGRLRRGVQAGRDHAAHGDRTGAHRRGGRCAGRHHQRVAGQGLASSAMRWSSTR